MLSRTRGAAHSPARLSRHTNGHPSSRLLQSGKGFFIDALDELHERVDNFRDLVLDGVGRLAGYRRYAIVNRGDLDETPAAEKVRV